MKVILFLIMMIGSFAHAKAEPYRLMAVCDKVSNSNYHGHATGSVTEAYAELLKTHTGYKVRTPDGIETGCDSGSRSAFEKCMKTKNHLLMEKVNRVEHQHTLAVYSINSKQLHITKEQRGVTIADVVLQCKRK